MSRAGGVGYDSAEAFRKALKDRLSADSRSRSAYSLSELQRHFAYDRALARCFSGPDAERWVLKGAGALLARLDEARHSKDLDLFYADANAAEHEASSALEGALRRDLGDFFSFETTRTVPLPEAAKGRRFYLVARLGAKPYASFHVDVVVGTAMSGEPDLVAPITSLELVGLVQPPYRAFPLVDHISDKLIATVEGHQQVGQAHQPSSRVKDLVDLALIAKSQEVEGLALRRAIQVGFAHRSLIMPDRFTVPDEAGWRARYPRVAQDARGSVPGYEGAVDLATRLLDPVLADRVTGRWSPYDLQWS